MSRIISLTEMRRLFAIYYLFSMGVTYGEVVKLQCEGISVDGQKHFDNLFGVQLLRWFVN